MGDGFPDEDIGVPAHRFGIAPGDARVGELPKCAQVCLAADHARISELPGDARISGQACVLNPLHEHGRGVMVFVHHGRDERLISRERSVDDLVIVVVIVVVAQAVDAPEERRNSIAQHLE